MLGWQQGTALESCRRMMLKAQLPNNEGGFPEHNGIGFVLAPWYVIRECILCIVCEMQLRHRYQRKLPVLEASLPLACGVPRTAPNEQFFGPCCSSHKRRRYACRGSRKAPIVSVLSHFSSHLRKRYGVAFYCLMVLVSFVILASGLYLLGILSPPCRHACMLPVSRASHHLSSTQPVLSMRMRRAHYNTPVMRARSIISPKASIFSFQES